MDVAYAPRELDAVHAVRRRRGDRRDESLRHRRRDRDACAKRSPIREKCVFVSPQNGVGNEEKLAAAFGADNVVAAALTTPVDRDRDGNARADERGRPGARAGRRTTRTTGWSATFASTGLTVKVVEDWRALKWSKLALNVVANASCAILNVLPNRFVHFDKIFTLEIRMIREVRAVMQALGIEPIDLPRYPVRALFSVAALPSPVSRGRLLAHTIAGARGTKPPSLLLDLRRAKPQTEVDVLNGAVAAAGREHHVPTPVNAVYARVLNDIAHTPPLWAKYRERPDRWRPKSRPR